VAGLRLSWLNETFSDSEVAGYSGTGGERKAQEAFPVRAGAMYATPKGGQSDSRRTADLGSDIREPPVG
jgi:hypothetical protein